MAMNEAEKARVASRKAFVRDKTASKGIDAKTARRRFYVQTRVKELEAKGVTVDAEKRKQLQRKFDSGNVARKGFGQPKKRASSSSSSSVSSPPSSSGSKPVDKGRSATSNMKGVSGYKSGSTKPSSKVSKVEKKKSSGGVLGALKGAKKFVDNNLMGKDDSKRAADYILKGDYKKAAKSVGGAALELGSLIGAGGIAKGVASRFGGKSAVKGAIGSGPKAIGSGPKALGTGAKAGPRVVNKTRSVAKKAPKAVTRKPVVKKAAVKKPAGKKPSKKSPKKSSRRNGSDTFDRNNPGSFSDAYPGLPGSGGMYPR